MTFLGRIPRRRFLFGLFATPLVLAGVLAGIVLWPGPDAPSFASVRQGWSPSEAFLLDRHGKLLDARRIDHDVRRLGWAPLEDVSPALVDAIIAGEDKRFRNHGGVDWLAMTSATWGNLTGSGLRGASTITMQLAAFLDPSLKANSGRDLWQKVRQIRFARSIEDRWTKDQILEAYLNHLDFRGELQGIAAATQLLAGKTPSGLDARESAVLAALLPSPNAGPARVAARACARHPGLDCNGLKVTARHLLSRAEGRSFFPALAPHLAVQLLRHPGAQVRTTLDGEVQAMATDVLARHLSSLSDRNVRDGAVLVADNRTGEILAYVGSAGPSSTSPQVDGVRAPRQAGSTLKPFLYGLAFERRYLTPASLLDDSPIDLDTSSGLYIPQNYDQRFNGPVSVRKALGSSLNIPAVRALVLVGVERFRDRLNRFGYETIERDGEYYGYSLALGSAEVTLWDQVAAFRALANGGIWSALSTAPEDAPQPARQIMPPAAAFLVADIMSDRAARIATFGISNNLNTRFWSAVKTGTSKDMRDNWCVGFSDRYTVGVWVGNFEGDSMRNVSGVTGAAPVWNEVMSRLHDGTGSHPPQPPEGVVLADVTFDPGHEAPRREWFLAGTELAAIRETGTAQSFPGIASPANGMIVAIDPDIPFARQRIAVEASLHDPSLTLTVNGEALGPASRAYMWPPREGRHKVELVDAEGTILDKAAFTVRRVQWKTDESR